MNYVLQYGDNIQCRCAMDNFSLVLRFCMSIAAHGDTYPPSPHREREVRHFAELHPATAHQYSASHPGSVALWLSVIKLHCVPPLRPPEQTWPHAVLAFQLSKPCKSEFLTLVGTRLRTKVSLSPIIVVLWGAAPFYEFMAVGTSRPPSLCQLMMTVLFISLGGRVLM